MVAVSGCWTTTEWQLSHAAGERQRKASPPQIRLKYTYRLHVVSTACPEFTPL